VFWSWLDLFSSSDQADESTEVISKRIIDEHGSLATLPDRSTKNRAVCHLLLAPAVIAVAGSGAPGVPQMTGHFAALAPPAHRFERRRFTAAYL